MRSIRFAPLFPLMMLCLAGLTACGGAEEGPTNHLGAAPAEVFYSYPYDGQRRVSPASPVVLRFSHPLTGGADGVRLSDADGNSVALAAPEPVDGGLGLLVRPAQGDLRPGTRYRLTLDGLETEAGPLAFPEGALTFETRLASGGANGQRGFDTVLRLREVLPDGEDLPFMDFSTLRLRFNQMLDTDTLTYGESISLTRDGELVPAIMLAKGDAVTLDPRQDLRPGERYTLTLGPSIRGFQGAALAGGGLQRSWVARDSRPRTVMVQETPPASGRGDDPCADPDGRRSRLTGQAMNCVPIEAVLLGDGDATQQSGNVFTELAFLPHYPDVSPLRIPRGSLLTGSNVKVKVAGAVPAGIETGDIAVTFLSDASGYLLPNPFSRRPEAPRQVRLFMDVAMTAENPEANGALSQTLLHVELVGVAKVEGPRLVIDALGVVEPEVLGQETAFGLLSLHTESYPDQNNAPAPIPDTRAPFLQSTMPMAEDGLAATVQPGDALVMNFSEPLDPESLEQALSLTREGADEPFDWSLDGASVVVRPHQPLRPGDSYTLAVSDRATDLAEPANPVQPASRTFRLPALIGDPVAPVLITTYPGFPCAVDKASWHIAEGDHGRCRGGRADDDHLPVPALPADRPIRVTVSQDIDPASVRLGDTCGSGSFRVERGAVDGDGNPVASPDGDKRKYQCDAAVPGRLKVEARTLTFIPDQPWEDGAAYRYTLQSVNRASGQQPDDCVSGEAICSQAGKRLQTALLEGPEPDWGGPDLEIHFRGAPVTDSVFQALNNLPTADVNANGFFDDGEPGYGDGEPAVNTTRLEVLGGSTLTQNPRLACDTPERCDIQVVGALNSEVIGPGEYDDPRTEQQERLPAVRVGLYPTQILASSVTVKADVLIEGGIPIESPTGTQVMRMRHPEDGGLIPGWIVATDQGPEFRADVDLYLDAPYLEAPLGGQHNQHSYPLTMELTGPVTFLPNGRMVINQVNGNVIPISVELTELLGFLGASIHLQIPAGAVKLQYLGVPLKR